MSLYGLPESEVATLIRALVGAGPDGSRRGDDGLDRDAIAERFARVAWGLIAEPGDGDAGRIVAALGVARALELLVERAEPAAVDAEVRTAVGAPAPDDAGGSTDDGGFADAIARWMPRLESVAVLRALRQGRRFGARHVVPGDPEWPAGVDDLGIHAPFGLWVRGDAELLGRLDRSIALVGARASTGYGEHVTIEAASGLAGRGFTIVSGAAYGIDGAAHRSALASGGGTVAFLAGGVDRFYPAGHETLLTRIVERGAVVSELPCGVAPTKWRFLQRNRLIAASTAATVVVEAGRRSGSLNTAGHAAALGRPVGAVPGPVTSSASAGCHRMLREYGAVCVTSAAEMAELAGDGPAGERNGGGTTGLATRVNDALTRRAAPVERIAALAGLSPAETRAQLALLEVEGRAEETAAGWRRSPG